MDSKTAILEWLEREYERCSPWLQAALDRGDGTHTLEDVWEKIMAGDLQFWPGLNAAMVTEVLIFPRTRVLNVFLAGGNFRELIGPLTEYVEEWAKTEMGCTSVRQSGRKGWLRRLISFGWKPIHYVMEREFK